ncbi:MAG: phytanoyl-CoA dioxygenase family protein [Rhodospirillaceae bacterium]|jgi:hypothetical protein|nr:phytanoyl-CoA dioxygenase family protein [Rhodospirillaceae bacterium]
MASLSEDQVASYHKDGFVIPDFQLPAATVADMRAAYDALLDANADTPGFDPDFILGPHLPQPGAQGTKGDPRWLAFAQNPDILHMLAQVTGPDLILWGMTVFGKPAHHGKITPWHQDGDYYPIEPLETTTVWIALDDATPENGCMRYMPGSHKQRRIFPHHWDERPDYTLTQVLDDDYYDEDKAVSVELKAGQIALHDVYMAHVSGANKSDHRRCGLVLRVMPATSHYNHAKGKASDNPTHDYAKRALFLLSGEDTSGKNDFSIGH